ncbi:MAG TPA: Bax inhibitor-1 family protein [Kofleriaceae bacterium]|nr:Bax inhibitor-1 family protein [Kofleriaceae bacterium]
MAFSQAHSFRSIDSAVATLGVSDRVAFLRRTYAHLGVALLAWAGLTAGLMTVTQEFSLRFSAWALGGRLNWLLVLGAFMLVGYVAERLATSDTSRGLQYLGLGVAVGAEALLLQPLLWLVVIKTGDGAGALLTQAAIITGVIFVGLTLTVFLTRKDFSFMRGALTVASFAAMGIIIASMALGFSLGVLFCGAMVLLMSGYILYQTSQVMAYFPPTHHVAAALMLFSTVATLFWYVVQLLLSSRD